MEKKDEGYIEILQEQTKRLQETIKKLDTPLQCTAREFFMIGYIRAWTDLFTHGRSWVGTRDIIKELLNNTELDYKQVIQLLLEANPVLALFEYDFKQPATAFKEITEK